MDTYFFVNLGVVTDLAALRIIYHHNFHSLKILTSMFCNVGKQYFLLFYENKLDLYLAKRIFTSLWGKFGYCFLADTFLCNRLISINNNPHMISNRCTRKSCYKILICCYAIEKNALKSVLRTLFYRFHPHKNHQPYQHSATGFSCMIVINCVWVVLSRLKYFISEIFSSSFLF